MLRGTSTGGKKQWMEAVNGYKSQEQENVTVSHAAGSLVALFGTESHIDAVATFSLDKTQTITRRKCISSNIQFAVVTIKQ